MSAVSEYLAELKRNLGKGNATEHTHRPALEKLLESVGDKIDATNEPSRIACGAPDFNITRGKTPVGHVETKDVGTNLDEMEKGRGPHGEQFRRYRDALANWILTDYLEFRWFVNSEKRMTVRIADISGRNNLKQRPEAEKELVNFLAAFYQEQALTVKTARELAERMAALTRVIRDLIIAALQREQEGQQQSLLHEERGQYGKELRPRGPWLMNWLKAFRETLIPDLGEHDFADMFAQTLAYGLFAARLHAPPKKTFTREMAAHQLPRTNPFLRKLFHEIAGPDLPDEMSWAVEDLVDLLRHADMHEILRDFGKGKGKEDPVVHFYETFLAAYDPKLRESRGVYYTPEPVVRYIVRSADALLKSKFGRAQGLADEKTMILDPAAGTATFLYFVLDLIYQRFIGQKGMWDSYVEKHLLNRLFGFELLMAPYAIAHLKLGLELKEMGYSFGSDQRLGIFLTNTLEHAAHKSQEIFANYISEEADDAAEVKSKLPIMVVLGNPPYSNFGRMNRNDWILGLLDDYKKDLNEKKINLDDDFIKFVRFAQWRIEQTGHGIVGFITNNVYLDGLTHRRMRQCLMEAFDEIYVLNLHGSSKKKETAPDGSKDENVFDITVGVSIALFVKKSVAAPRRGAKDAGLRPEATVFHADLFGLRENKYEWLWKNEVETTKWTELKPDKPNYFFVPTKSGHRDEYERNPSLTEIFMTFQNGIKTDRDELFVDFDRDELERRIKTLFSAEGLSSAFVEQYHVADSSSYDLLSRRKRLKFESAGIRPFLYRPFDSRWVYYSIGLTSRPAYEVMRHIIAGPNFALICLRQTRRGESGTFLASRGLVNKDAVSLYDIGTAFPLYLYPDECELAVGGPRPNFTPAFVKSVGEKLGMKMTLKMETRSVSASPKKRDIFTPEDVFHYAYAIFHSPTYRSRYAEFLKIDFPRLPLTSDKKLFFKLADLGADLVGLHVMESPKLTGFITKFPKKGNNTVEKVSCATGRVQINDTQYFDGVPENVWNFHIGGYQVCEKWLKDRKGRTLSYEDLQHYQKIVVALSETIRLMTEIDRAIPAWPIA